MDQSEDIRAWLLQRNTVPLEDAIGVADLLIAARHFRLFLLNPAAIGRLWADYRESRHVLRAFGSTPERIGDLYPDLQRLLVKYLAGGIALRWLVVAATVASGVALQWGFLATALAAFGALTMLKYNAVSVVFGLAAAWLAGGDWWEVATTLYLLLWFLYITRVLRRLGFRALLTPPYAAGAMPNLVRLRHPRRWSLLATAMDLAISTDPEMALRFIDASRKDVDAWTPCFLAAEAAARARLGEIDRALALSREARDTVDRDRGRRALIALVEAEVLAQAGQPEAALSRLTAAAAAPGRSGRLVRSHATRKQVDLLISAGRQDRALSILTGLRWGAVNAADGSTLKWTEMVLVNLMLQVGNLDGVRRSVEEYATEDAHKGTVAFTASETISHHLISATSAIQGNRRTDREVVLPTQWPGVPESTARILVANRENRVEETSEAAAARAATQAEAALIRLANNPDSALTVQANYLWARAELQRSGSSSTTLWRLLAAVRESERLRFRLPATTWRLDWASQMEELYADTLIAAQHHAPGAAVAELIEVVRSQPTPVPHDTAGTALTALMSAAVSAASAGALRAATGETVAASAGVTAELGADLVRRPPGLRIEGNTWCSPPEAPSLDVESCIRSVAGDQAWYLGGVITRGQLWLSSRTPDGAWESQATPLLGTAAGSALRDLFAALPAIRGGNSEALAGPLATDYSFGRSGAEVELLQRVADAVLPIRVQKAFAAVHRTDGQLPRLVIGFAGLMTAVPMAGLPLRGTSVETGDPVRLVEVADIIHIPSWATVAESVDLLAVPRPTRRPPGLLAVLSPRRSRPIRHLHIPPAPAIILRDEVTRSEFEDALRADIGTGYLACHGDPGIAGQPASGGLEFNDGVLTARNLLESDAGGPRYRLPERLLLASCESFGASGTDASTSPGSEISSSEAIDLGITANREWLGFPIGSLAAGARHIIATRYVLDDSPMAASMDAELVELLSTSDSPLSVVGQVQRRYLDRWRSDDEIPPMLWQAYSYLGFGEGPALNQTRSR